MAVRLDDRLSKQNPGLLLRNLISATILGLGLGFRVQGSYPPRIENHMKKKMDYEMDAEKYRDFRSILVVTILGEPY